MLSDPSLLPPNATSQERDMANTVARISDVPVPVRDVWNVQTCPSAILPWLAWSDDTKRAVIASSISLHRIKGTVASVKRALAVAGYPGAQIIEGVGKFNCDGTFNCDGLEFCGDPLKWAWFRVTLPTPISNSQAAQVKRIIAQTAPARCQLEVLDFQLVAALCDGEFFCDGTFNLGVV
jgi:phage tail P2-like protein